MKTDSFVDIYWPTMVGSSEAQRRSVEALTRQEPKDEAQTGSFGALNGKKRGARVFGIGCKRTRLLKQLGRGLPMLVRER